MLALTLPGHPGGPALGHDVTNRGIVDAVERALDEVGFHVASPPVANFVYAESGGDATALFGALLREGVIVRPLGPFGAPGAIRVSVGAPEENDFFASALKRVIALTPQAVD